MSALLSARGLGKEYVLRSETSLLLTLRGKRPRRLWALRNVDVDVHAGEVLAVVGRNGAGKSTLLKLASGVTAPTVGSLRRPARTAPLIEVGAGFHPEMSGRENVEVNARLLGIGRTELRRRFDEIVGFADLAHAIDQPVKEYSSGMYMRLGFAVAVHTDPEMLVVDEVLAVGDLPFQVRCMERIRLLRDGGVGVLFVSHNMSSVAEIADRALFLEKGTTRAEGDPRPVIGAYQASLERTGVLDGDDELLADNRLEIGSISVCDADGAPRVDWLPGERMSLRLEVRARRPIPAGILALRVHASDGRLTAAWHQGMDHTTLPSMAAGDSVDLTVDLQLHATAGSYRFEIGISSPAFDAMYVRVADAGRIVVIGPGIPAPVAIAPVVEVRHFTGRAVDG